MREVLGVVPELPVVTPKRVIAPAFTLCTHTGALRYRGLYMSDATVAEHRGLAARELNAALRSGQWPEAKAAATYYREIRDAMKAQAAFRDQPQRRTA